MTYSYIFSQFLLLFTIPYTILNLQIGNDSAMLFVRFCRTGLTKGFILNIAIIDDSRSDAHRLLDFITEYCTEAHIYQNTTIYSHTEDFLFQWKPGMFHLVFVDIFFQSKASGISLAEEIRKQDGDCAIVFTTVSTDFAVQGFEVRALDYLVKPIAYNSFSRTMDYYLKHAPSRQSRYIEVKESRIMVKIPIDDIIYTDYFNHYIQIHLKDRIVRTYMRFDDFSSMILEFPQFLHCYRNCIVNMNKVTALEKSNFIVTTGEYLPITRNIRPEIHQKYADYQFRKLNGGFG